MEPYADRLLSELLAAEQRVDGLARELAEATWVIADQHEHLTELAAQLDRQRVQLGEQGVTLRRVTHARNQAEKELSQLRSSVAEQLVEMRFKVRAEMLRQPRQPTSRSTVLRQLARRVRSDSSSDLGQLKSWVGRYLEELAAHEQTR